VPNFCGSCGHPAAGMRFCQECGQRLGDSCPPARGDSPPQDWWCAGGGPDHSNFSASESTINPGTLQQLDKRWSLAIPGGASGQPIVVDGRVYVAAPRATRDASGQEHKGGLICVDALSGLLIWRNADTGLYNSNSGDLIGSPTYYESWLYCQYGNGPLWAIDAESGDSDSAISVGFCGQRGCEPTPTIANNSLFYAKYSEVLVVPMQELFVKLKEDFLWFPQQSVLDADYLVLGSLAVSGDLACAVTVEGVWVGHADKTFTRAQLVPLPEDLYRAVRMPDDDGEPEDWQVDDVTTAGCVAGLGYFTSRFSVGDAYRDAAQGDAPHTSFILCGQLDPPRYLWHTLTRDTEFTDTAIAYDMAIYADRDGVVHAMSLASGELMWKTALSDGSGVIATPLAFSNLIMVGTLGGHLYALDARSGKALWEADLKHAITASPAISDGWLYVPTASGISALSISSAPSD